MANEYTQTDALDYAERFEKEISDVEKLDYVSFNKALKFFACSDDKPNFKKLINTYKILVENSSNEELRGHSFSLLEFICIGLDHGFTKAWYCNRTNERLELGKAQKML